MNTAIAPPSNQQGSRPTEQFDSLACLSSREHHRALAAEARPPGPHLQIEGHGEVLLIALDAPVVHLGRGITAGLHLDDASISRRHAVIVHDGRGRRILDDRSLNGTFVNGRRVERADLYDGDVISLGQLELVYRTAAPLSADPPRRLEPHEHAQM